MSLVANSPRPLVVLCLPVIVGSAPLQSLIVLALPTSELLCGLALPTSELLCGLALPTSELLCGYLLSAPPKYSSCKQLQPVSRSTATAVLLPADCAQKAAKAGLAAISLVVSLANVVFFAIFCAAPFHTWSKIIAWL